MPLLIFIYSIMGLLICKYQPFWQEVGVESLILRWLLRPVGLLFFCSITLKLKHCNISVDWTQHAASRWTITCCSAIYSGWITKISSDWMESTSSPFHHRTNGLAESLVQGFKQAIKKDTKTVPMNIRLNRFLCTHRSTPHPTIGESLSKLYIYMYEHGLTILDHDLERKKPLPPTPDVIL